MLAKLLEFIGKSRRDTRLANIIPAPHDMMFGKFGMPQIIDGCDPEHESITDRGCRKTCGVILSILLNFQTSVINE